LVASQNDIPKVLKRLYEITLEIISTNGMTRLFIFLFISVFSVQAIGQQYACLADTASISGQILERVKKDGFASFTITNKRTGKKYQGYRICEHHSLQMDSLNQIITDLQIDSLFSCDNGTLKNVAFILFAKRHNNKESVVKKLNEILNQEYIVMTNSCSDAIQMTNLGRLSFGLLTKPNFFIKPNFKLTKKDKALIELELAYYELPMKAN
jgi:hypothetical protein